MPSAESESAYVKALKEFNAAFGIKTAKKPTARIGHSDVLLRRRLLLEEVDEYTRAVFDYDIVGIADALADILYIAHGTALAYGIDIDAVFAEVHRSNMSKLGEDGKPIYRDDGKVLKGPNYSEPDIAALLGRRRG